MTTGIVAATVVGEEAHIRSRKPDGPRHDLAYPTEKLDEYENLLLLCPTHHSIIDAHNGDHYTVEDLIAMRKRHEKYSAAQERIEAALGAYLGEQYARDDQVLFEQVDLRGPSVDSMFVDVPVTCRADGPAGSLVARIAEAHPGDLEAVAEASGQAVVGAAQALLHPEWAGSAVLVGGPGQGKSTLLQYLCQFHRAKVLGKSTYSGQRQQIKPLTAINRTPFRLDLRNYAQWARSRAKVSDSAVTSAAAASAGVRWPSIEEYIVDEVKRRSGGHDFGVEDLASLVAGRPVLIAFDGLDEVANVTERDRVSEEIVNTHARLSVDAANLVILAASRPGSTTSRLWSSQSFPALYLQKLSHGLRLQYLQQWVEVAQLSEASAERLQRTFMENEHVAHIRELASYPMQLAILLHLLHRRQLLPQQRTELFRDYLTTFLDREQATNKEPLLAGQRRVIEDVHAYLGWHIQTKAEQGDGTGTVTRKELRRLIREQMDGRNDGLRVAEEIFTAVTSRVLCLVEREPDAFQFDVQSLREFFAAKYIFENAPPRGEGNSRDDCFNELLIRPYWSNVCRFFVGMLSTGEIRSIRDNLDSQSSHRDLLLHPHLRSMATLFLNDRAYEGQRDNTIAEVVDFIVGSHGVLLAEDGLLDVSGPLELSDGAGREQVVQHINSRLPTEKFHWRRLALARSMRRHAASIEDVRLWWWQQPRKDLQWLETATHLGALMEARAEEAAEIAAIVRAVDSPGEWFTAILANGGFDGRSDELTAFFVEEMNNGAIECVTRSPIDTPLWRLIDAARQAQSWGAAGGGVDEPNHEPRKRIRDRGRLGDLLAASNELRGYNRDGGINDQRKFLRCVFDHWGDGWVLRQAVAALPHGSDLLTVRDVFVEDDETLRSRVGIEAERRLNRADPDWWRHAGAACEQALERQDWVCSLLTLARPSVVVKVADLLNEFVDGLAPKRFRSLLAALGRTGGSPAMGRQVLVEPIRLRQVDFGARALWLLRIVASDATREFIDKRLVDVYPPLLQARLGDMRPLLRVVGKSKTVRIDNLRNSRAELAAGGWASDIKLGAISAQRGREIALIPDEWPSDVVQRAIDTIAERLTAETGPLFKVAAANNWFPDAGRS